MDFSWIGEGLKLVDSLWVTPQEQFDQAAQQRQLEAQLQAQELQLQLAQTQTAPALIGGSGGGLSSTVLIGGGLALALVAALVILR